MVHVAIRAECGPCTVAVNKKFTFRLQTTIVLRSVPFIRNLPVLQLLSQQLSPSRVSGQVRQPLSPVTSKLQTKDKRQRIVKPSNKAYLKTSQTFRGMCKFQELSLGGRGFRKRSIALPLYLRFCVSCGHRTKTSRERDPGPKT